MRANPNETLPVVTDDLIPMGSVVMVTIGRGVGRDLVWSDAMWREFQAAVCDTMAETTRSDMRTVHHGVGEWEGVEEESAVFTFFPNRPLSRSRINDLLSSLSRVFRQDAIAWTYGPNLLARPDGTC